MLSGQKSADFVLFRVSWFSSLIQMRAGGVAREAAWACRLKWQWQPAQPKPSHPTLKHEGRSWHCGRICTMNSHCFLVKHCDTIILKRLMEAVQKAFTVRIEAATRAFASTSHKDSQRATWHLRNPSCSPGHPLPTAERLMFFQQASMILTIKNSKLFQFM